jgi:hypothetical protein
MHLGIPIAGIIGILMACLVFGRIFSKAGYSSWMGLLMLVPVANIMTVFWFAYADWPIMQGSSK